MNRLLLFILILWGCTPAVESTSQKYNEARFGFSDKVAKVNEPYSIDILNWTEKSRLSIHLEKENYHCSIPASSQVKLPPSSLNSAGLLHVYLYSQGRILDKMIINVQQDPDPESLNIRWTPKDVTAGSLEKIEVISLARDKDHKSISSSQEIALSVNGRISNSLTLDSGFSAFYLNPPTSTGRLKISTRYNSLTSEEGSIDIHPSTARPFKLSAENNILPADGRSFFTVTAQDLRDSFGNSITDGTLVFFIARDDNGSEVKSTGIVLGSSATTYFQHPLTSGQWNIIAWCGSTRSSDSVSIDFEPYIKTMDVVLDQGRLDIGPIMSFENSLAADGTPVDILLNTSKDDRSLQIDLINGRAQVTLDDHVNIDDLKEIVIQCGGRTKSIMTQ